MKVDKQLSKQPVPPQLVGKGFQPGISGNPAGRPPGKTLKEFAREWLLSLPDDKKAEYLSTLPFEIVWKMSEGNPHSTNDVVLREPPKPIADVKRKGV